MKQPQSARKKPRAVESALIITGGRVHTTPERTTLDDLQVDGAHIASEEIPRDSACLLHVAGASVVPLFTDTVFEDPQPPPRNTFDLSPGHSATFAVIKGAVTASQITRMLVVQPRDLVAVVINGLIIVHDGAPTRSASTNKLDSEDPRLGAWTDSAHDMTQHLTPDGRYRETRNGRTNAYTGRFWLTEDRITYFDDTGFWAFGQYHRGVLHHAGYILHPEA